MKICAIVCEYNPFHQGHAYQLQRAKQLSAADAVVCIMSGNFTQRGDAAILPEKTRAKHAVQNGADAVLSLPTVFATSSAEFFARGAIRILSSIPDFCFLSFGAEHSNANFYEAAAFLNDETTYISALKQRMQSGCSFVSARSEVLKNAPVSKLLQTPNDVLAIEYARSLLAEKGTNAPSSIRLLPVERKGDYKSNEVSSQTFASARAIRNRLSVSNERFNPEEARSFVPQNVQNDLSSATDLSAALSTAEKIALLRTPAELLKTTLDCTEGLENALKKAAQSANDVAESLTSRRYTASRIRRVCLHNLLGIREKTVRDCLVSPLYLRPVAIKKGREDVLSAFAESHFPCLIRHADENKLSDAAKRCLDVDKTAAAVYAALSGNYTEDKRLFF